MRRLLGATTATLGLAALVLAGAPAATAATLPPGDAIYTVACDDELSGQVYRIDPTTGVATRVGDWVNPDTSVFSCAGGGAYDRANGLAYWVSWGSGAGKLISLDLKTGVNTLVGDFSISGVPYYTPLALAIDGAGNAFATSWSLPTDSLFSVNLATAELTVIGATGVSSPSNNYGFSWDPVTNGFYAYNYSSSTFYTVNTTTGAFTPYASPVLDTDFDVYAFHFDSAGNVWAINDNIKSAPLADLSDVQVLTVSNPSPDSDGNIYSESIIIAPAPALPATGIDGGGSALLAGLGALLVVGGVVIARRRVAA